MTWLLRSPGAQPPEEVAQARPLTEAEPDRGVVLGPDVDVETEAPRILAAPFVIVEFPSFRDGRGFSTARLLKGRLRYPGLVLARGPLLPDQVSFLWRSGFDGVEVREDARLEAFRASAERYARFPQPAIGSRGA